MSMKLKNVKSKFPSSNLAIVDCGFVFIILFSFFLFPAYQPLSYDELIETNQVITDNEVYDLMNELLSSKDSVKKDSMKYMKISVFPLKHSKALRSFIIDLEDTIVTQKDKEYMLQYFSTKTKLWDEKQLRNIWCIKPSELAELGGNYTLDYWQAYRKKFGDYGKHSYSKPIFNKDRTVAVIEHSGGGGWLLGSGAIWCFTKVDRSWRLTFKQTLWIS